MALTSAHRCTFVTRPRLMVERGPPDRPPWRRTDGYYCLMASCDVRGDGGEALGRVVGYDRYLTIQDEVQNACRVTAAGTRGASCGPVNLTLLRHYRKECAGEVYFMFDGRTKRLLP